MRCSVSARPICSSGLPAPEWLATAATGFGNIPFARDLADAALDAANEAVTIVAPEAPDLFEFA